MKTQTETKLEEIGVTRTWYIPVAALGLLLMATPVRYTDVTRVFSDKVGIVLLVLAFAVASEGLRVSGVFDRAGTWVSRRADNTYQLVLYFSVMTAVATVFTSNDIVILGLTPVIISVATATGITNLKILLLSQFVIANTLSMATYIGSPTNIILSQELGVDFVEYAVYMTVPAAISFMTTMLLIFTFMRASETVERLHSFRIEPLGETHTEATAQMERSGYGWILLFGVSVCGVAVLTIYGLSLLWCAVPLSVLGAYSLYRRPEWTVSDFSRLPYGIVFFGVCFFVIGDTLVSTDVVVTDMVPVLQTQLEGSIAYTPAPIIVGSAILVNIVNDLPAAAILAPLADSIVFQSRAGRILVIQSLLIGLNIGKYLTQVGALAGILWFKQMNVTDETDSIVFPDATDLLVFGLVHFVFTGTVLSVYLSAEYLILTSSII